MYPPSLHRLQLQPLALRYFPHRDGLCSRGCPSPLHAPLGCQNQPPAIKGALASAHVYYIHIDQHVLTSIHLSRPNLIHFTLGHRHPQVPESTGLPYHFGRLVRTMKTSENMSPRGPYNSINCYLQSPL